MITAAINRIISFSNVDGPGNRCAIFFQSCPFSCLYCHNPETIRYCINCGQCVKTCPVSALSIQDNKVIWNKDICVNCDTCIKTCPNLASPKISYLTSDDLIKHIESIKPFIRGITVSGGECMNHADFLLELFTKVKKLGLTCLIDSNGAYDFKLYPQLIDICDGVMLDVKAYDANFHQQICHYSNDMVLKNLTYLKDINKLEEVRTVILPDRDEQNINTVSHVAKIIGSDIRYKLLKYRYYGVRQEGLDAFGKVVVDQQYLEKMQQVALDNGCSSTVII